MVTARVAVLIAVTVAVVLITLLVYAVLGCCAQAELTTAATARIASCHFRRLGCFITLPFIETGHGLSIATRGFLQQDAVSGYRTLVYVTVAPRAARSATATLASGRTDVAHRARATAGQPRGEDSGSGAIAPAAVVEVNSPSRTAGRRRCTPRFHPRRTAGPQSRPRKRCTGCPRPGFSRQRGSQ